MPLFRRELLFFNMLIGKMELDEVYEVGASGTPENAVARGVYRLGLQVFLIGLFTLLLVGVAGLKAALSFVFSALVLWKLFFPLLLGYPPLLTGIICFSVGGLARRGLATFVGSMLGLLLTHLFRLHGAVRPFAERLLYSDYDDLNLTDIFVACVFIACSGAVMDLAMDIAATMDESTPVRHRCQGPLTVLQNHGRSSSSRCRRCAGRGIPKNNKEQATMLSGQELDKGLSVLKIIWTALTVSLIMYVFAVPVMLGEPSVVFPPEAYTDLRLVMYGGAFATLIASWFVRRFILARKPSPAPTRSRQHPALQRYTTAMIIALAMAEAIGLYGLVLYLLGKNHTDFYALTVLSAAAMTLYFPKKEEVIQLAEKFERSA